MALQIRRGTNAQRLGMTPLVGELVHVTDFLLTYTTVTTIATNLMTTSAAHGLTVGQKVKFISVTANGLTQNTIYYVIAGGFTTTKFKVSLTLGGAEETLTNGTSLSLQFAKTPTLANGDPVGYSSTALFVGDGVTVGGIACTSATLNDLVDVNSTLGGVYDRQHLEYDSALNQWINRTDMELNGNLQLFSGNATIDTGNLTVTAGTVTVNKDNGLEFEITGTNPYLKWDNTNQAIITNTTLYATNDIIANRYFGTNDRLITFNNEDANPTSTDNMTLRVKRGTVGTDAELTWNETTDRWELNQPLTTLNGNGMRSSEDLFGTGYHGFVAAGTTGNATVGNILYLQRQGTNADTDAYITVDRATAVGADVSVRWNETTDMWQFTNDGTNYVDMFGASPISAAQGDFLWYDGTNWTNNNVIKFVDAANQRPTFTNADTSVASGAVGSGLVIRRDIGANTLAQDDGTGIIFQVDSDSTAVNAIARVAAYYDIANDHEIRLQVTPDNFGTTYTAATFAAGVTTLPAALTVGTDLTVSGNTIFGATDLAIEISGRDITGYGTITSTNDVNSGRRVTLGAIRDATTDANGDSWSQLAGAGAAYRGLSIDNSANTAKRPALVIRSYSGGASNPRSTFLYETARGTPASPTALQFGDYLGEFASYARTSTGWIGDLVAAAPAAYTFYAAENFTALTNVGTGFVMSLQPTATTLTAGGASRVSVWNVTPQQSEMRATTHILATASGVSLLNMTGTRAAFNQPVAFRAYTAAALTAITGAVGYTAAVSDQGGKLAYWDTTNSRWSYVHDNSAV